MLPALWRRSQSGPEASLTTRRDWSWPLESSWAVLTRWQFLNRLPFASLAQYTLLRPSLANSEGVDLRVREPFSIENLAHHTRLSPEQLASSFCARSALCLVLEIASPHLRFCSQCMQKGFHATLFQFTPLTRCPIHQRPLLEACPKCRLFIAYRLDAGFAAHPFRCPHCAHRLMKDPTVLARQPPDSAPHDTLLRWQRFVATYAYWYADGQRPVRAESGCFAPRVEISRKLQIDTRMAFLRSLQSRLSHPPPLPTLTQPAVPVHSPWNQPLHVDIAHTVSFSPRLWPHFHHKHFSGLANQLGRWFRMMTAMSAASPEHAETTLWWRRSWEGAISRTCTATTKFDVPPFGLAEWLGFTPVRPSNLSRPQWQHWLGLRLERDLEFTWNAWFAILTHVHDRAREALHPKLVPTRACWLGDPPFDPCSTALGF